MEIYPENLQFVERCEGLRELVHVSFSNHIEIGNISQNLFKKCTSGNSQFVDFQHIAILHYYQSFYFLMEAHSEPPTQELENLSSNEMFLACPPCPEHHFSLQCFGFLIVNPSSQFTEF